MTYLIYILGFVVLLGVLVFVHEMGHLLGGKMVGIKSEVFSIGYGKGIWKKKWGDTTYQVTLIPFGGYCKFYGEASVDGKSNAVDVDGSFSAAAPWRRIVTVAMGPLFNLFFGIGIFFALNFVGYNSETNKVFIPDYLKSGKIQSVAYAAGMKDGDVVIEIDGKEINKFQDIQASVVFSDGKSINVKVKRDNKIVEMNMLPKISNRKGLYSIDIMPYGKKVMIRNVSPYGAAYKAGLQRMDVVLAADGEKIENISEFSRYVSSHTGEKIQLKIKRRDGIINIPVIPKVSEIVSFFVTDKNNQSKLIFQDSKANFSDYLVSKKIKVDGKYLESYESFMKLVEDKGDDKVILVIGKKTVSGNVEITKRGLIGVGLDNSAEMRLIEYGFFGSIRQSFLDPIQAISLQLKGMGKLFTGKLDVKENLSGPVRIGKMAGDILIYRGIGSFILLMANLSLILMIMNFLPIPVVDGGHLVFFTIEMVRGKPLSEPLMQRIQTVGVLLLMSLFVFVMINDISSLDFVQKLFK